MSAACWSYYCTHDCIPRLWWMSSEVYSASPLTTNGSGKELTHPNVQLDETTSDMALLTHSSILGHTYAWPHRNSCWPQSLRTTTLTTAARSQVFLLLPHSIICSYFLLRDSCWLAHLEIFWALKDKTHIITTNVTHTSLATTCPVELW